MIHFVSSQVLYEFVFSNSEICSPFGIYTCHPRALIQPESAVTGLDGALIVEEGENLIDPFALVEYKVRMCSCVCCERPSFMLILPPQ